MTIPDYVKQLIKVDLEKPTLGQLTTELRKRKLTNLGKLIVDIVRDDRESH